MDSANSMSLDDFFDQLEKILGTLIETKKKTRDSKSQTQQVLDLITYSQTISAKYLEDYLVDLELSAKICNFLMNEPPTLLSALLIRNTIQHINVLNQYNTLIRSARKITKKNQLAYNFQITLQKILDGYTRCIRTTTQQHAKIVQDRKDILQSSVKERLESTFKYYQPVEFFSRLGSSSQKWYAIHLEKETQFTINNTNDIALQNIFPSIEKKEITLNELIKSPDLINKAYKLLEILNKQDLTEEFKQISSDLLWVYSKLGILKVIPEKIKSKDTKTKLKRLISNAYFEIVTELFRNTKYENVVDEPLKILSKIALECENGIQEDLVSLNLPPNQMEEEYSKRISLLMSKFEIIKNWLSSLIPFLSPYEKVAQKFIEIVEDLTIEINRKQEEFGDYSDVLFETDSRASVDQELDLVLQALDEKVSSYEKTTMHLMEQEIPQIKQMQEIMKHFQQEFDEFHIRAQNIFKQYENQNVNIYDAVKRWEETYFAEKHRAEFLVTKMLSILLEKFQAVVKKEKTLTEFGLNDKNSLMLSPGVMNPQTLTDEQIRSQMLYIDKKLKDLEEMKSEYIQTKISYKAILEKRLEKKDDITSKICVICHKKVDVVSDEYIRCEFCGRLSHYLCSAWWLEKYGSCPVCNNVYLVPGSDLYDSDQVEK
jgi:hypothetical protein